MNDLMHGWGELGEIKSHDLLYIQVASFAINSTNKGILGFQNWRKNSYGTMVQATRIRAVVDNP